MKKKEKKKEERIILVYSETSVIYNNYCQLSKLICFCYVLLWDLSFSIIQIYTYYKSYIYISILV